MTDQLKRLEVSLKSEVDALQQMQKDVAKNAEARRKFTQQLQENEMVLQELDQLEDARGVFKLIGPTLIRQDPIEARSNVAKRLDFIRRELERLDAQAGSLAEKQARKQQQIQKIQAAVQGAKPAAAAS